jgi:hypothetical protein
LPLPKDAKFERRRSKNKNLFDLDYLSGGRQRHPGRQYELRFDSIFYLSRLLL